MRRLVACPHCRRQYNAPRARPGMRFRCRCGRVVVVAEPRGHAARVVRCSSCGAPRHAGAAACCHCGADFTLHERDRHTICPECLTRVSDRARYCHSCGTPLCPQEEIGAATPLVCPACLDGPPLHSRRLGRENVSALECDRCAGLWLGSDAFRHLARRAHRSRTCVTALPRRPPRSPQETPPPQRAGYRPCPRCRRLMNRRNYGLRSRRTTGSSGTIIDYCKDHGLWFEAGELNHILAWLRTGGPPDELQPPSDRPPSSGKPFPPKSPCKGQPLGSPSGIPLQDREPADWSLSTLGWLVEALFDAR